MRTVHPFFPSSQQFDVLNPFNLQNSQHMHAILQDNHIHHLNLNQNLQLSQLQSPSQPPQDSHSVSVFPSMPISAPPPRSPSPSSHMSIQSLLAASKQPATHESHIHSWSSADAAAHASSVPKASSSKRKLDDVETEDPEKRARRVMQKTGPPSAGQIVDMTTVICLHAAVAQKSYGSEKRFLCPPPLVRIEGPFTNFREQQLAMSIVSENGDRSPDQKAPLDMNMMASFKYLHVTGTAKAKSFQLSLQVAQPQPQSQALALIPEGADQRPARTWATFESAPVTIISKPSKKTAKTRNMSSCILAGGPVSLFNRINSQTVRTKYMTIDRGQLCASNVSWSAFNVNVLNRPVDTTTMALTGPQPVTYGSEVVLQDNLSLVATAPLIIRKVDKGKISDEEGGPVSQMQKIALQRVNPDGSRHYLSAAGPLPGATGVVAPPPAPGSASQTGTHHLLFSPPRIREEIKDGVRTVHDEVDDYLCWTIVGISKFQYTFFDASGNTGKVPDMPITPFPTLFTAPTYTPASNSMDMTVSNFFYDDPKTGHPTALEVWIGHFGPLPQHAYPPTASGPLTSIQSYPSGGDLSTQSSSGTVQQLGDLSSSSSTGEFIADGHNSPTRYTLSSVHTHVVVTLPSVADIVKALHSELPYPLHNGGTIDSPRTKGDADYPHPPPSSGSPSVIAGQSANQSPENTAPPHADMRNVSLAGRSLPLLFVRAADGVGYHTGRTVTCENVFETMEMNASASGASSTNSVDPNATWIAAAQAAAARADGGMHGWALRVL